VFYDDHARRRDRLPEGERLRTPVAMRGVPYDWGGSDSLERFDDKIKRGFIAGNIGGTFWSTRSRRVTTGVDCSGLVSNVWHLDHHAGTSESPDLTKPVARLDRMRVGDVLLRPDHHVALYREQVDLDGASIGLRDRPLPGLHAAPIRPGAVKSAQSVCELSARRAVPGVPKAQRQGRTA
jgi:hypothetical protein